MVRNVIFSCGRCDFCKAEGARVLDVISEEVWKLLFPRPSALKDIYRDPKCNLKSGLYGTGAYVIVVYVVPFMRVLILSQYV
jgi:hypothetical protein